MNFSFSFVAETLWELISFEKIGAERQRLYNEEKRKEAKEEASRDQLGIHGVKYTEIFPGDKTNFPKDGYLAKVHYILKRSSGSKDKHGEGGKSLRKTEGARNDAKSVENALIDTFKLKTPFVFLVGGNDVIEAWELVIKKMSVGERALFEFDAELCYEREFWVERNGEITNLIQPREKMIFEIELIDTYLAPEPII